VNKVDLDADRRPRSIFVPGAFTLSASRRVIGPPRRTECERSAPRYNVAGPRDRHIHSALEEVISRVVSTTPIEMAGAYISIGDYDLAAVVRRDLPGPALRFAAEKDEAEAV
jgi:hypothetical protein